MTSPMSERKRAGKARPDTTRRGGPTAVPEFAAARGPPLLALAEAAVSDERCVELDAEFVEPEI